MAKARGHVDSAARSGGSSGRAGRQTLAHSRHSAPRGWSARWRTVSYNAVGLDFPQLRVAQTYSLAITPGRKFSLPALTCLVSSVGRMAAIARWRGSDTRPGTPVADRAEGRDWFAPPR